MSAKSRAIGILKDLGWKGVIAGFLLSVLFQPFAVSWATQAYVAVGAPGFERPHIDSAIDGKRTIYQEGQRVPDFGNLKWESDYELIRFNISNPTRRYLSDVKVYLPLPACSVYDNTEGPSVGGEYRVEDLVTSRVQSTFNLSGQTYSCAKKIHLGTLSPYETASVEFVIRRTYSKCDRLLGIASSDKYLIQYNWEERNVLFEEQTYVNISSVSNFDYTDNGAFVQKEPATVVGPHEVEGITLHQMLVGIDETSYEDALKQCRKDPEYQSST